MPKAKWKIEKPVTIKLKLFPNTLKRYKGFVISKGRTMQQDLEEYVINCLK